MRCCCCSLSNFGRKTSFFCFFFTSCSPLNSVRLDGSCCYWRWNNQLLVWGGNYFFHIRPNRLGFFFFNKQYPPFEIIFEFNGYRCLNIKAVWLSGTNMQKKIQIRWQLFSHSTAAIFCGSGLHMIPSSIHVVVTHTAWPILASEKKQNCCCAQGWTGAIMLAVKSRMYRGKQLPSV